MPHAESGMAAAIRAATEPESFDLAGQSPTTISNTIKAAFSEPLHLTDMIRITFVTGAGKLARQKYDEGAAKAVTSTLRDLGYEEDRGASAVMECAGTYKQQHDTGKNLKTVVVFPRVVIASNNSDTAGTEYEIKNMSLNDGSTALFPESSPEHSISYASIAVFERMLSSKCQTWTEKKGCNNAIGTIKTMLEELEQKLMSGHALDESEQNFYDDVPMSSLDDKLAFVKKQMHQQVEDGKLTAVERKTLLLQVGERLASLVQEKGSAEQEGKAKRVQNLAGMIAKAEERKEKLEKITPKAPPPLKHEAEINKLRTELEPLLKLDEAKGRLLSLKETQALGRKEGILEQIKDLEDSSRGWFEVDEAFEERLALSESAWKARMNQQNKKKKPASSSSSARCGKKNAS